MMVSEQNDDGVRAKCVKVNETRLVMMIEMMVSEQNVSKMCRAKLVKVNETRFEGRCRLVQ